MSQTQIIAHRGSSSACHENTMAAFERAVADGADGIEFDVRLTRDRQWVVHHDAAIDTAEGPVTISSIDLADVMRYRVGPNRETIPRLDDFLLWAREQSVGLVFDIKDREGIPELIQATHRAGLSTPVLYTSFHRIVLKEIEGLKPDTLRGLIVGDPRSSLARRFLVGSIIRWSVRHRLTSLHLEEHWVVPSILNRMKEAGLRLAIWTVDDPLRMGILAALEIDAIITNQPDLARITLRGES